MDHSNPPPHRYSLRDERTQYDYTFLSPSKDSIRLLRLHPSPDPSSPLHCTLFHTTLSTAPPYIALSYAWGSDRTSKDALLIGESKSLLYITSSLNNALLRLRSEVEELIMWVDAVCINQQDIPERNSQTTNMRAIYQNAESVAVWLGGEYSGSGDAVQFARDAAGCTTSSEIEHLLSDGEEHLRALVKLFRRQYWWRIWVIQEVTCGRRVTVYCGDEKVEWDTLERACEIFKEHEDILKGIFYKNQSFVRTLVAGGPKGLQLSRYSPGHSSPPLLELLISHKGKKSSEPRDKVFALVGISSSRYSFGEIDYSKSLRVIFSHAAKHIVEKTRRLDIVCLKQSKGMQFDLPSWAPNWVRGPAKEGSTLVGLHHFEGSGSACGGLGAEVEFLGRDGYVMRAKGIVLDTISETGVPFFRKGSPADPIPSLRVFLNWWNIYSSKFADTPASLALFGRVVSCGNWRFEGDEQYIAKLDNIFALSEDFIMDEELVSNPPSRSSTWSISRSSTQSLSRATTMSSSTYSLPEDEDDEAAGMDNEERERLGTILSVSVGMNQRRLMISENGLVGLGLWNAEVGDKICILLGCRFPVVLRRVHDHYVLIGEAFVDGMMDGEAIAGMREGKYEIESYEIH